MKTKLGYILVIFLIVLFGCDSKDKTARGPDVESLKKPEQSYLNEKQIQTYLDKEINLAIDVGNENIIQEAADVIALTRTGIISILKEDYEDAIETINRAIAKAELVTRTSGGKKIVSEVNIEVLEKTEDAQTARQLIQNIDSLMKLGELQKAKNSMDSLTSELRITRESVLVNSYLQTLKNAAQFLQNKKYDDALLELNSILGNISVERSITPLPLIIAQKMILEMEKLANEDQPDKGNLSTLTENAEYQVSFSELLGYGKGEKEYQEIFSKIEKIRDNLQQDNFSEISQLVDELKEDLTRLQNKISVYKPVNANKI